MYNESFLPVCYLITEALVKFMGDVVGVKWINHNLAIIEGSNKKYLLLGFGYSDTSTSMYIEGNIRCLCLIRQM